MKYFISIFIVLFSSCTINNRIIKKLYFYESNQFIEPNKPRNIKALKVWKSHHIQILKERNGCDSFIIIDWYDSSRMSFSSQSNIEYYGSRYYFCKDTGYIFRNHDSIRIEKDTYKNRIDNFIQRAIYDSIVNGSKIEVRFSGTTAIRIIQIVRIRKGKISVTGFNLNRRLRLQKRI